MKFHISALSHSEVMFIHTHTHKSGCQILFKFWYKSMRTICQISFFCFICLSYDVHMHTDKKTSGWRIWFKSWTRSTILVSGPNLLFQISSEACCVLELCSQTYIHKKKLMHFSESGMHKMWKKKTHLLHFIWELK